jgi:hypothetical protein
MLKLSLSTLTLAATAALLAEWRESLGFAPEEALSRTGELDGPGAAPGERSAPDDRGDFRAAQAAAETSAARHPMAALARVIGEIDGKRIPQSRRIEEQLQASYSTGQTTLPEVIRARGRRFELEAQRLDAPRDYHPARVRYSMALGGAR